MYADLAPRGWTRPRHRLSPALQTPTPGAVRLVCPTVPGFLQTKTEEPEVRAAPAGLVRAGTSRGRLRRNLRRVADATFAMATPLSRLARPAETRVHR